MRKYFLLIFSVLLLLVITIFTCVVLTDVQIVWTQEVSWVIYTTIILGYICGIALFIYWYLENLKNNLTNSFM